MFHRNRIYANEFVFVDKPRFDLMSIRSVPVAIRAARFETVEPDGDVVSPRFRYATHHPLYPWRPENIQRIGTIEHPRAVKQIWKTNSMIGMQVGNENMVEARR